MTFYKLIEIAVNLSESIENKERLNTPATRKRLVLWQRKLDEWLKENYKDEGILKRYKEEYKTSKK